MENYNVIFFCILTITINTQIIKAGSEKRSVRSFQQKSTAWPETVSAAQQARNDNISLLRQALCCLSLPERSADGPVEDFNPIMTSETRRPKKNTAEKKHHRRHKNKSRNSVQIATLEDLRTVSDEEIETKTAPYIHQPPEVRESTPEETAIQPINGRTFHSIVLQDYNSNSETGSELASTTSSEPGSPITFRHSPHTPPRRATPLEQSRPGSAQKYISLRTIIENKNNEISLLQEQINALETNTLELRDQLRRFLITSTIKPKPVMISVATNTSNGNIHKQDQSSQTPKKFGYWHTQTGQCIEQIRKSMLKNDEIVHADIIELATQLLHYKRIISSQAQEAYINSIKELQTMQQTLALQQQQPE